MRTRCSATRQTSWPKPVIPPKRSEVVGRNALDGRWSYQIVEEFEDLYWLPVRERERLVTERLLDGRRHVHEAEMKQERHTPQKGNM